MLVREGLKSSSTGVRVRFSGKDLIVTDGPFAETTELVASYWIREVNRWKRPSLLEIGG